MLDEAGFFRFLALHVARWGWTHQYAGLIGSARAHREAAGVFSVGLSVAAQTTLSLTAVTRVDIGPKPTPTGRLATLLRLTTLRAKAIMLTWGEYFQVGWRPDRGRQSHC